jgi:hypothetical protein
MLSKARVIALAAGNMWLDKAANLLLLGIRPAPVKATARELALYYPDCRGQRQTKPLPASIRRDNYALKHGSQTPS